MGLRRVCSDYNSKYCDDDTAAATAAATTLTTDTRTSSARRIIIIIVHGREQASLRCHEQSAALLLPLLLLFCQLIPSTIVPEPAPSIRLADWLRRLFLMWPPLLLTVLERGRRPLVSVPSCPPAAIRAMPDCIMPLREVRGMQNYHAVGQSVGTKEPIFYGRDRLYCPYRMFVARKDANN